MNIEDALRADGAAEHPNPLAGRGSSLVAAVRRRRRQRSALAGGVVTAAVVAVGLAAGAPWLGLPPIDDPTAAPTDTSADPVAPVRVCDVTIDLLRPDEASDIDAELTVVGDLAQITLTNTSSANTVDLREGGNEVWLVDADTGDVVASQADLTLPLAVTLGPGESTPISEALELTPCDGVPPTGDEYLLYARGYVVGSASWFAGPVDAEVTADWFAASDDDGADDTTEPEPAIRPDLCVGAPQAPLGTPPAQQPGLSDVRVSRVTFGEADAGLFAEVTLGNTADEPRTVYSHGTEFVLVDRLTLEAVGYAAVDAEPVPVIAEPGVPTVLEQPFSPVTCDGDPLPDGWYLLYARGAVGESEPWLAEPRILGWVDGEPGLPTVEPGPPADERAVPFDLNASPWTPPDTSSTGLTLTGDMPTVPLSGAWDDADTIQQIGELTNGSSEPFRARVYGWVVLVEPDGDVPYAISCEPPWATIMEVDLAPGEGAYVSALSWLGCSVGDHRLPTDPATLPGTYDAYIVMVDVASYDPGTSTGFAYAVAGPYPLTVD